MMRLDWIYGDACGEYIAEITKMAISISPFGLNTSANQQQKSKISPMKTRIYGKVVDQEKDLAISAASVEIKNIVDPKVETLHLLTDIGGGFNAYVVPGTYEVSVSHNDFTKPEVSVVTLSNSNLIQESNWSLKPASLSLQGEVLNSISGAKLYDVWIEITQDGLQKEVTPTMKGLQNECKSRLFSGRLLQWVTQRKLGILRMSKQMC